MEKRESMATLWQQARVRAAIFSRYIWSNPAAAIEFFIWSMALTTGAVLAISEVANDLTKLIAICTVFLGCVLAFDALRYHWKEAVMGELHTLDRATKQMQEAGERPAVH